MFPKEFGVQHRPIRREPPRRGEQLPSHRIDLLQHLRLPLCPWQPAEGPVGAEQSVLGRQQHDQTGEAAARPVPEAERAYWTHEGWNAAAPEDHWLEQGSRQSLATRNGRQAAESMDAETDEPSATQEPLGRVGAELH